MVRLELLDGCDEKTWDDLVARFDGGTIFHTLAWMRVVERLKRAEALPFGILDGSDIVGVFPVFRLRRGPFTMLLSPVGHVGYGGPLAEEPHLGAAIGQIGRLSKCIRAQYTEIRSLHHGASLNLPDMGFSVHDLRTIVLSLDQGAAALWKNLKAECRTSVRRAQRHNVEVIDATDESFLDAYCAMAEDTFAKSNRRPPLSKQDYATVLEILRPRDRIKVLLAMHEDRIVAGAIFLRFEDRLYFWDGASFRRHYQLNANNLLHWHLIEWAARNGISQYDMMGANIPSITRFKKSFGGEIRPYTYAYQEASSFAKVGRRLYRWLAQRFLRLSPKLLPGQSTIAAR